MAQQTLWWSMKKAVLIFVAIAFALFVVRACVMMPQVVCMFRPESMEGWAEMPIRCSTVNGRNSRQMRARLTWSRPGL